ncbi:hypothetical protein VYU27_003062 [Nannochloropsis oceanica]
MVPRRCDFQQGGREGSTPPTYVMEDEHDVAGDQGILLEFGGEEDAAHCGGEGIKKVCMGGFPRREDGGGLCCFGDEYTTVEKLMEKRLNCGHDNLGWSEKDAGLLDEFTVKNAVATFHRLRHAQALARRLKQNIPGQQHHFVPFSVSAVVVFLLFVLPLLLLHAFLLRGCGGG